MEIVKYKVLLQTDETTCGVTSLAMICEYYGIKNIFSRNPALSYCKGIKNEYNMDCKDDLAGNLAFNPNVQCNHHDHEHGEGHTCGEHGCGGHNCGGPH